MNICLRVALGWGKGSFSLQKGTEIWAIQQQETDWTSYPGLKDRLLTLHKVERFRTHFYFFQHQHLIAGLTGAQDYKRFTLFLWMYTLFTIQSIKYLPISPLTAPYSVLTTSLLLEADQISGWHLSRNGPSQQLAGDHILCICQATWQSWVLKAFLKVLRRGMGLSSLPTPPTHSNIAAFARSLIFFYSGSTDEHLSCAMGPGEMERNNIPSYALRGEHKPSDKESWWEEHPGTWAVSPHN